MLKLNKNNGWIDGTRHCPSPNYDDRPEGSKIDLLVIHNISLPPGQYGGEYIEQLFTNNLDPKEDPYFQEIYEMEVSSHLLINRLGEIIQFVPLTKRAWHAGISEFQGCECCNDFSIGIELEGCDDEAYEDAQYASLVELTRLIQQQWPEIEMDRIVGHCDIAPDRKTDPGESFDWIKYKKLV
ncbi:MAG: 1,6-anhydro-N-acetylmuramyl-L-alanine amidase AmpD [Gammaproteobacteria bacterium]